MIFMTTIFLVHVLTEASFRVDIVLKFTFFLYSPAKVFSEGTQINTPLPKKAIGTSPAISHSVRKALGNVNGTEGVMTKMEKIRQKNQACTANKVSTTHFYKGGKMHGLPTVVA